MADWRLGTAYIELATKGTADRIFVAQRMGFKSYVDGLARGTIAGLGQVHAKIREQNASLKREANPEKIAAGWNRFGEAVQSVQANLQSVRGAAGWAFGAGTAAITSLTAAASPDAINTFTGSVRLLSGEVGSIFLPRIAQASLFLQNLRDRFRALSPETKDAIAQTVVVGTAAAAAAVGVGLLAVAVAKLGAALSFLAAHPLAAGVTALGTAAAVAAYKTRQIQNAVKDTEQKRAGVFTYDEYYNSQARRNVMAAAPKDRARIAAEQSEEADRAEKNRPMPGGRGFWNRFLMSNPVTAGLAGLAGEMGIGPYGHANMEKQRESNTALKNDAALKRQIAREVVQGRGPTIVEKDKMSALTSMQMAPASIGSIQDVMNNLEVRSLSRGPLEEELEKQRSEGNAKFQSDILRLGEEIKVKLGAAN